MKALLLAAGLGTRLRPFTFQRAKAALPLFGIPFIHYPLQFLFANAITDVVINLHAHPDTVQHAAGQQYRTLRLSYSHEPEILGTAGAIRQAAQFLSFDEPLVVMNGDMLTDIPLRRVLDQHSRTNALVTLVVMRGYSQYKGLPFTLAEEGVSLLQDIHAGEGERLHYTGVQLVSPEVIERIPPGHKTEIFTDIYPEFIRRQKVFGFVYDGIWKEIGTLNQYLTTSNELTREPLPQHLCPPQMESTNISKNAKLLSENVTDSIIMDGATIHPNAVVEESIIGWDVNVSGRQRKVALAKGFLPWHIT